MVCHESRRPSDWALGRREATSHGEIAFDVIGHGPPVVLVHGTPSWSVLWRKVAPVLAERFSVYVLDLLGFGDSERHEDQALSIARHAKVLAELAQAWQLERPAFVGHDIGGATVVRAHLLEGVAAHRLALIDAVVLAPWITPTTRHIRQHLDVYRTMPAHIFREVAAAHLSTATLRPMDADVFAAYFEQWEGERGQSLWLRNVAGFDERDTIEFEPALATMTTPTLVVWGREDAWLDPAVGRRLATRLPNAQSVSIPEAGHFVMEDQPERLARALADFLAHEGW